MVVLALLAGGGCGSSGDGHRRVPVEGVVTLDGRELETGTINFVPTETAAAASAEIVNGRFQLPKSQGPSPGPYRVEVYSVRSTGRKVPDSDNPKELVDEKTNIIPARYNVQSELKVDILATDRVEPLSFQLVTKKSPRG